MKLMSPGDLTQGWGRGGSEALGHPQPVTWAWERCRVLSPECTLGPGLGRLVEVTCHGDVKGGRMSLNLFSVSTLLCSDDLEEPFVPPVPVRFPWELEWQRHHSAEVHCPQDATDT